MKKGITIFLVLFIYLLGVCYLLLPQPEYPDLSDSRRSDEPGDTWQHPDQKAFFTQKNRQQVLEELQSKFSLSFLGYRIPSYRLNYRPEEATTLVRDQLFSYYLEEIIHPLRESIFVNGWEPQNSPMFADKPEKERDKVIIDGITYRYKVTLKAKQSSPSIGIFVWTSIFPASFLVYLSLKHAIS